MTVLTNKNIRQYLNRKPTEDPLVVMPLINPKEQCKTSSIDLRLAFDFILIRRAELSALNLSDPKLRDKLSSFYERVYVGYRREFVLHPGELVLGCTLEYICMPHDLMAYLVGRSTWGRLGLIIATATLLHPGFKGSPTLEILNNGTIPILLYPGWCIAQLVFHKLEEAEVKTYRGKYTGWVGPTSPEFSKICDESDMDWLIRQNQPNFSDK